MNTEKFYEDNVKVGDYVFYFTLKSYWEKGRIKNSGVVIKRKYLFDSESTWGPKDCYKYNILNEENKIVDILTENSKIIKVWRCK